MCGITGFWSNKGARELRLPALRRMSQAISHRGPDSDGVWQDSNQEINLGHRRLAIIDLTPTGHQPMVAPDGSGVLTYNGEIYNFPDLRAELSAKGVRFVGSSDTEVLLQGILAWGVIACLRKLNGMFAFAYWDAKERALWIARDRFGEKPVYYSWQRGQFFFPGGKYRAAFERRC